MYKTLIQLEAERVAKINEYKQKAKQRLALHRLKPNKIRDYVKTTHDEDIELDLFKHYSNTEKDDLYERYTHIYSYALDNNYNVLLDDFLFNTSFFKDLNFLKL